MTRDIEQEIYEQMYRDAPRNVQVKILDAYGRQVGDGQMMTEDEVNALYETLPSGWTIEEV
jgi:hypothetical protein